MRDAMVWGLTLAVVCWASPASAQRPDVSTVNSELDRLKAQIKEVEAKLKEVEAKIRLAAMHRPNTSGFGLGFGPPAFAGSRGRPGFGGSTGRPGFGGGVGGPGLSGFESMWRAFGERMATPPEAAPSSEVIRKIEKIEADLADLKRSLRR